MTECGLDSQNEQDLRLIFDHEYEKVLEADEMPEVCPKCDAALDWTTVDDDTFN
jgi:hypothetical protein